MSYKSKDSTVTIKVMCAMLFVIFVISYVYSFQCDVLAMIQYAWSGGLKHYDRNIGAIVLSVVSFVIATLTAAFSRLPAQYFSLNFYPAFLTLGMLTAVSNEGTSVSTSKVWFVIYIILLVASFFVIRTAGNYKAYMQPLRSTGIFSHVWWTNLILMVIVVMLVFSMGNTDRTLHTRLSVERLCMDGDYDKAIEQGFPQYDNDSSLTMLRAMALSHKTTNDSVCLLGERLFQYDITGNSKSLFPQKDKSCTFLLGNGYNLWQTVGFVPYDQSESPITILKRQLLREEKRQKMYNDTTLEKESRDSVSKPLCKPVARDYLLCAYLLDKNLKEFVKLLPKYYVINNKMPQHYREACVLYSKLTGVKLYSDAALEADCMDFLSIMRSNRTPVIQNAALRDSYFGTYWYYYYKKSINK